MYSILKKEINSFFASSIAYLVIGVFLLVNGLFLWVFNDDFNILHAGFADLNSFFSLAPWILLFLVSALTMKSFSDEFQNGTIEILKTRPISDWQIIQGKFLASVLLVVIAIAPTLIYVYSIYQLGNPVGNIDFGSVIGSYLGLTLLAKTYAAIGIFTSTLSKNQIVAFLLSILLTFFIFFGFDAIANLSGSQSYTVQSLGINEHYKSISRGVIDTRDIIYFISVILFFLTLTKQRLQHKFQGKQVVLFLIGALILNIASLNFYQRLDVTKDKRHTLSQTTTSLLKSIENQLLIQVYLEGDFPSEFKRLQIETRQFLEELRTENSNIKFQFLNPDGQRERLIQLGMMPSQLTVEEAGKLSNAIIFPWAEISLGKKTRIVSLLPQNTVGSQEEQLEVAVENLEYSFATAIDLVQKKEEKKVAVITGNGELEDSQLFSFLKEVTDKYRLAKFTLDSVQSNPNKSLKDLQSFDLAIIAKPTESFTEEEKFVLDQFIVNGGKSIWMLENVQSDTDSLYNSGKMLAYPRDLNLTDMLFQYGVRINSSLVQDLYAAKIPLATGNIGNQTQFQHLPWFYHPLITANPNHPISKNMNPIRVRFANPLDTLQNGISKTPLLVTSPLTKKVGTPTFVELQSIASEPKEQDYQSGYQLLGVLLEGEFSSAYNEGRIKPFQNDFQEKSQHNKMIVISDGDIGRNQILKGEPYDLSLDKWTGEQFGNKDFLLNAIDYLLDDSGLLELRNKTLQILLLDKQKAYQEQTKWQLINIVAPILLLLGFGFGFNYLRRRKHGIFIKNSFS